MGAAPFKYSEALVAAQIGVTRDQARDLRLLNMEKGLDWKNTGGEIRLTEDAVRRMAKLSLTSMPDLELCVSKPNGSNGQHPPRQKMRVCPPMPFNPRMVKALDEGGEIRDVFVGRNATFCFDDEIEVEPHETQPGIFQCVSPIPRDRRRVWRR